VAVASLWLADKMSKYTILLVHLVSPTGGYILSGPKNFLVVYKIWSMVEVGKQIRLIIG
jgi:hypothetical protein